MLINRPVKDAVVSYGKLVQVAISATDTEMY